MSLPTPDVLRPVARRCPGTVRSIRRRRLLLWPVWDAWLDAYERGDSRALAELFTDDGIYAANTGQLLRGRTAIRTGVQGWIERPAMLQSFGLAANATQDVIVDVLRFRAVGDFAYALSRFEIRVEPTRCLIDAGYLNAVWRRTADRAWRVESLVVNQLREPPENACGRRESTGDREGRNSSGA